MLKVFLPFLIVAAALGLDEKLPQTASLWCEGSGAALLILAVAMTLRRNLHR